MIRLEKPSAAYRDSFIAGIREIRSFGNAEDSWFGDIDESTFDEYLAALEARWANPQPPYVPYTVFWIVDQDGYAGRIGLRHHLTESLLREGGNIGYVVRPSKRGRGYAKAALSLALDEARALGLDRVLLTCDEPNLASRRVIESAGGVLENGIYEDGKRVLRYWITL